MEIPTLKYKHFATKKEKKEKNWLFILPGFPVIYPAGEPVNIATSQLDTLPFMKVQLASAPRHTNLFLAHHAQTVN